MDLSKVVRKEEWSKKSFTKLTECGKTTQEIRKTLKVKELRFATESKLWEVGQLGASKLMCDIKASLTKAKEL